RYDFPLRSAGARPRLFRPALPSNKYSPKRPKVKETITRQNRSVTAGTAVIGTLPLGGRGGGGWLRRLRSGASLPPKGSVPPPRTGYPGHGRIGLARSRVICHSRMRCLVVNHWAWTSQ